MALVKEVDGDWIQARVDGQVGLVPLTYITILEPLSKHDSQDDIQSVSMLHLGTHCSVHYSLWCPPAVILLSG